MQLATMIRGGTHIFKEKSPNY